MSSFITSFCVIQTIDHYGTYLLHLIILAWLDSFVVVIGSDILVIDSDILVIDILAWLDSFVVVR